jgi:DNA end-binding protein Ku
MARNGACASLAKHLATEPARRFRRYLQRLSSISAWRLWMATRPYWSGNIRLSLVSIPVDVIAATKPAAKIAFHQVHKPSGSRVKYQKVVPGVGEVSNEDIVKGYEVDKGKYVLLTEEEINEVKLEARKTIDLVQFVDLHEIKACGDGMMMETLNYADEVKKASTTFKDIPDDKPDADMIELAEELIKKKSKKFDPAAFHDKYEEALREIIDAKEHHRQVKQIEEPQQGAKVINLMDALRRSVKGGGEAANENERGSAKPKAKGRAKAARKKPAARKSASKRKAA